MIYIQQQLLKTIRKIYTSILPLEHSKIECVKDANVASQKIYEILMNDQPCMIARFGSNELLCLVNYINIQRNNRNILSYITGKSEAWWWNKKNLENMHYVAGFFPPTIDKFQQFCELMLQDIPQVDILGSWLANENYFKKELALAQKVHLRLLEPYWAKTPWTRALKEKKVLVVHPFENEIIQQFKRKELLFTKKVLPDFELKTLKSVQSLADEKTKFTDWFQALDYMKTQMDNTEYDICLIGCGAYGFHLAAHAKRMGKKAIHLGGALQLLFGIKGKRWEDPNYGVKEWNIPQHSYVNLMNEYWIRPNEHEKPKNSETVEGGCYW